MVVPEMPGTQEKQARPGMLAQQWVPTRHPGEGQQAEGGAGQSATQQWMANNSGPPAQHLGSTNVEQVVAEERRRSQAMEGALKDVLTMGEGAGMLAKLMQARGHGEVVGMIASGGVSPSVTQ